MTAALNEVVLGVAVIVALVVFLPSLFGSLAAEFERQTISGLKRQTSLGQLLRHVVAPRTGGERLTLASFLRAWRLASGPLRIAGLIPAPTLLLAWILGLGVGETNPELSFVRAQVCLVGVSVCAELVYLLLFLRVYAVARPLGIKSPEIRALEGTLHLATRRRQGQEVVKGCASGAFLPICLYSQRMTSKHGLYQALMEVVARSNRVLLLVCDDLHALNVALRQNGDEDRALKKARKHGEQVLKMVQGVVQSFPAAINAQIYRWSELATAEYDSIRESLRCALATDAELQSELTRFVLYALERRSIEATARNRQLETEYVLGEMAMSVYATVVLEYQVEIWENGGDAPPADPIGFLFFRRTQLLTSITRKPEINRELVLLG